MTIVDTESPTQRFVKRADVRKKNLAMLAKITKENDLYNIEQEQRVKTRESLLDRNDGLALERIIGANDLLEINYLEKGIEASNAICRIQIRDIQGRSAGYGTGFMVSPNLLMTNNHVLQNTELCRRSLAEFNFQDDVNFIPKESKVFPLDPDRFYYTNPKLDFTLIAVRPIAVDDTNLSTFGCLKLIEQTGKALLGEYLTIIQHPGGGTKAISLRENRIMDIFDDFVHYLTDTQPGSSGSPAFNDQWQVIALHHKGIEKRDDKGNILAKDGTKWQPSMGDDQILWEANEGIRISSICKDLRNYKVGLSAEKRTLLNQLLFDSADDTSVIPKMDVLELAVSDYDDREGYDPDFLGKSVPLPQVSEDILKDCVALKDGSGIELKHTHFSLVMNKSRRLALYTAVNIDGTQSQSIQREKDKWYFDPRIEKEYQCGPELYANNDLDRGHLVRRLDPVWGSLAKQANDDTFHFTNCSPQHKHLNQETWANLENYILKNAGKYGLKVSVFTGPVFREDDMIYRGEYQIPAEFWKVVVMVNEDDRISATAYLQTQKNLIRDLEFAYGEYQTYQVPVTKIEALTGLDYGVLRNYDPIANIEGTIGRVITRPEDIQL
jgi:endonuclease G